MKKTKICCIMIILLTLSSTLFAQGIVAKGVKFGINLTHLTKEHIDQDYNYLAKTGLIFGCFLTFELFEKLEIQPELFYTMKGAKFEVSSGEKRSSNSIITFNYNYIEIPVLLRIKVINNNYLKHFLFCGPALSYNINSTMDVETSLWGNSSEKIDYLKTTDYGIVIGTELSLNHFLIDIRYNLGLTNVLDIEPLDGVHKNKVISFMSGYSF